MLVKWADRVNPFVRRFIRRCQIGWRIAEKGGLMHGSVAQEGAVYR